MRYYFLWGVLFAVLMSLIASIYGAAVGGPFLLDDYPNLSGLVSAKYQGIFDYVLNTPMRGLGRPLAYLTFYWQMEYWPADPEPFKWFNIAIHLANSCLVGVLVWLIAHFSFRKQGGIKYWVPFLAAFAWSLLAIHASTVLYVVQRMTLLSAFFTLLGMVAYVLFRGRQDDWSLKNYTVLCVVAFIGYVGVFAKENAILFGWFIVLVEWFFFRKKNDAKLFSLSVKLPTVVFLAIFISPTFMAFGYVIFTENVFGELPHRGWNWWQRLITEGVILWDYADRILLPSPLKLNIFNDHIEPLSAISFQAVFAVFLWCFLLLFVFSRTLFLFWVGVAALWYLVGHAFESTILPLELAFEHRNYLPSLAIVPLGVGVFVGVKHCIPKYYKVIFSLLFGLFLANQLFVLSQEVRAWKSKDNLTAAAMIDRPESPRANQMLAEYLLKEQRVIEASQVIRRLVDADPENPGLALQLVYLQCFDSRVSVLAENELRHVLRRGRHTPAAEVIDDIRKVKDKGGCKGLSWNQFRVYVNDLMQNRAYRKYKTSFYRIRAYSFFHQKLYQQAMGELDRHSDQKSSVSYLMVKLDISAHMKNYDRALNVIGIVREKYEQLSSKRKLEFKELLPYIAEMEDLVREQQRLEVDVLDSE